MIGVLLLVSSARGQEDVCSDLNIKASDGHFPWYPFEASLVLTEQQKGLIRDVRWTITKHNTTSNKKEVESVKDALSVETRAWNANEPGYITWLVVARLGDCISGGVTSSMVVPNPGTPYLIDEFGELPANDEKGRLDLAVAEMNSRNRNEELIIFAEFRAKTSWKNRRLKVKAILDRIVDVRGFDPSRVTLVLTEGAHTSFRFQPVPQELVVAYTGNGSMTIPGERFNDFSKLFR